MKKFKPMLMPNEQPNLDEIKFAVYASYKLDGIRCIFKDGKMLSRSLKEIPNKQLQERFKYLKDMSKHMKLIFDGEIYAHGLSFQKITHFVMCQDLTDLNTHKRIESELKNGKKEGTKSDWLKLPYNLKFHLFDTIDKPDTIFSDRKELYHHYGLYSDKVDMVKQNLCYEKGRLQLMMADALEKGYEGLILRNPDSKYKFGRVTLKSGDGYKLKPYETFDSKITGVVQATEVREGAEKKVNELGRSVTSKKKDDRIPVERASAFWVTYEDKPLKVTLAMTNEEKEEVWKNQDKYIGRYIEYKGMKIGAKDVPRHPVMCRFREDKDEN